MCVLRLSTELSLSHDFLTLVLFQSPKKVNLVAALVRGMRVEDALMQLQVTVKRASHTVYRVISKI